jgi:hypothetical protein
VYTYRATMTATLLSYLPIIGKSLSNSDSSQGVDIPAVEVHNIETDPDRRARCLKHLLKANHVNHSILYHNLQFDNHNAHILCSAYLLGASKTQLQNLYDVESRSLEPWEDSPSEVIEEDWRDFLGDKQYQRAYVDFFEDSLAWKFSYDWKKTVEHFMFEGRNPLVNCLIGGRKFLLEVIHCDRSFYYANTDV